MRITANQLTFVRILLIPIPCALMILGGHGVQMLAWALYILVGITDFFDGMLARKYGSTRLGSLLDPIADKIYIALLFLPMSLLGFVPHWLVVAIIIRDPIITSLRSISQLRGITMKTASLAQYKTAIQMITGGYMIWAFLVPEKRPAVTGMVIVLGLCLLWLVVYFALRRRLHPRLLTLVGMVGAAPAIRTFFSADATILICGIMVLVVTWASGIHYLLLLGMRYTSGAGKVPPQWLLSSSLESLVLPLAVLVLQGMKEVPLWVPMGVICIEFAVGAFDNLITAEGNTRHALGTWIKLLLQLFISGVIFLKLYLPGAVPVFLDHEIWVDAYLLFGVTLLSFIFVFAEHGMKIIFEKT
jgi:cardiolipin synthase